MDNLRYNYLHLALNGKKMILFSCKFITSMESTKIENEKKNIYWLIMKYNLQLSVSKKNRKHGVRKYFRLLNPRRIDKRNTNYKYIFRVIHVVC